MPKTLLDSKGEEISPGLYFLNNGAFTKPDLVCLKVFQEGTDTFAIMEDGTRVRIGQPPERSDTTKGRYLSPQNLARIKKTDLYGLMNDLRSQGEVYQTRLSFLEATVQGGQTKGLYCAILNGSIPYKNLRRAIQNPSLFPCPEMHMDSNAGVFCSACELKECPIYPLLDIILSSPRFNQLESLASVQSLPKGTRPGYGFIPGQSIAREADGNTTNAANIL